MIAVLERPDVLDGIPRVITSKAQNERYISALREMERHGNLTGAEKNLAEVLTLWSRRMKKSTGTSARDSVAVLP
jgi:hypothetical protein